eukprot:Hpha_TRINITY_DN9026_c0_g1::TRINITY_DN9026_c0_g1_i1::g.141825::m.141825
MRDCWILFLCYCVLAAAAATESRAAAADPLGGWTRDSSWEPHPVAETGLWRGQSRECTNMYVEWIGRYSRHYRVSCTQGPIPSDTLVDASLYSAPKLMPGGYLNLSTATEGGCAEACLAQWMSSSLVTNSTDDAAPEEEGTAKQEDSGNWLVPARGSVPSLNGSDDLPLRRLSAVWDPATESCWCALGGPLSNRSVIDLGLAAERMDQRCPELNVCARGTGCEMVELAIPLGCLWSGSQGCIEAPADSCIWTLDECCVDSKGYDWPLLAYLFRHPPWWAWVAASILVLSTCVLLVQLRRLRLPPIPEPDDPGLNQELVARHLEDYEQVLENAVVQLNPEGTVSECSVCLEALTSGVLVRLPACGHMFHKDCMREYVQHQVRGGKRYPRCPNCRRRVCQNDDELRRGVTAGSPTDSDESGSDPGPPRPYESPVLEVYLEGGGGPLADSAGSSNPVVPRRGGSVD